MSDDIKYVISKLDKLDERIDSIDITLAKQHSSLEEHMKRSDQNETAIMILQKESDERLKRLESHKDMIMSGIAVITTVAAVSAWIYEQGFFK